MMLCVSRLAPAWRSCGRQGGRRRGGGRQRERLLRSWRSTGCKPWQALTHPCQVAQRRLSAIALHKRVSQPQLGAQQAPRLKRQQGRVGVEALLQVRPAESRAQQQPAGVGSSRRCGGARAGRCPALPHSPCFPQQWRSAHPPAPTPCPPVGRAGPAVHAPPTCAAHMPLAPPGKTRPCLWGRCRGRARSWAPPPRPAGRAARAAQVCGG